MKKYADQDDDDRELAMIALGHLKIIEQDKTAAVAAVAGETKGQDRAAMKATISRDASKGWEDSIAALDTSVADILER